MIPYIDIHCDTLTFCADNNFSVMDGEAMASVQRLLKGGCAAQCFAIFTHLCGEDKFNFYLNLFNKNLKNSGTVLQINCMADFLRAKNEGKLGAVLTVENLAFTGGDLNKAEKLKAYGVKMASLVWNFENAFAYPNLIFNGNMPDFCARERRGLKPLGKKAVEILDDSKIIVDISHLSDGGAEDILNGRKIPVVASHSNAFSVCGVSRNLTDGLIKKIALCGGAIGVNFCKDFLGEGEAFDCVLKHIKHFIKVGGEDIIALGSDFDGIPEVKGLESAEKLPELLNYLNLNGVSAGTLEKLAYKNFYRVFSDVCG